MKLDQFNPPSARDTKNIPFAEDVNIQQNNPIEESSEVPEPGDVIRTKRMQMQGKVESVKQNRAGYDEVLFRIEDGRLMKTPVENVIVIEKLADDEEEVMEDRVDEISTEVLAKYKAAAGKDASAADKKGDVARGNKRFSGIVKATKKQFDNDAKKTSEGSMGGINRVPSLGLSYEKVLDEVKAMWEEEQLNELSVDKLRAYRDAANSPDVIKHSPLRKIVRHTQGSQTASQKIKTKTGDQTGKHQPDKGAFEEDVFEDDPIVNLIKKQYADSQKSQPRKATVDIEYHGWNIRYRPAAKPGDKVVWQVMNRDGQVIHRSESMTDKDAVADAEEFIRMGNGTNQQATSKVTIDFNEQFRDWFAKDGETFYASIIEDNGGPVLLLSTEPQKTLKKSHSRSSTHLPMISLSAEESNSAKLEPNGRYLLGDKQDLGDNLIMFPLINQGITHSKNDKKRLGQPGLTVAATRT